MEQQINQQADHVLNKLGLDLQQPVKVLQATLHDPASGKHLLLLDQILLAYVCLMQWNVLIVHSGCTAAMIK